MAKCNLLDLMYIYYEIKTVMQVQFNRLYLISWEYHSKRSKARGSCVAYQWGVIVLFHQQAFIQRESGCVNPGVFSENTKKSEKIQDHWAFCPIFRFLFFVGFGWWSYENTRILRNMFIYNFLKVLPDLPCTRKPS